MCEIEYERWQSSTAKRSYLCTQIGFSQCNRSWLWMAYRYDISFINMPLCIKTQYLLLTMPAISKYDKDGWLMYLTRILSQNQTVENLKVWHGKLTIGCTV